MWISVNSPNLQIKFRLCYWEYENEGNSEKTISHFPRAAMFCTPTLPPSFRDLRPFSKTALEVPDVYKRR